MLLPNKVNIRIQNLPIRSIPNRGFTNLPVPPNPPNERHRAKKAWCVQTVLFDAHTSLTVVLAPLSLEGTDDDSSDFEVDSEECKARDAEGRAKTERKKAGLPELELDQLPSTIAPKMLSLFSNLKQVVLQFLTIRTATCRIPPFFIKKWIQDAISKYHLFKPIPGFFTACSSKSPELP